MASAASRKLLREPPSLEDMLKIIMNGQKLKAHCDVAAALLGAVYIERALESLLK